MALSPTVIRRWIGAGFLACAAAMLVLGLTMLQGWLERRPIIFVCYWLGCLFLTGLTFLTALLDLRAVRRRARREQIELAEKTWSAIVEEKARHTPKPDES